MAEDNILVRNVMAGVSEGVVVEDYPEYPKGRFVTCRPGHRLQA